MNARWLPVVALFGGLSVPATAKDIPQRATTLSVAAKSSLSGPPAAGTALSRVLSEIGAGGTVPLDTALEAFSLVVGPVPGAAAPSGPIGEVMDGTFAVRWALAHFDQMTPAQRAAVRRDLSGRPLGIAPLVGHSQALAREPDNVTPPAAPYLAVAENASKEIAAHIGHPLSIPISVVVNATQMEGDALAYTYVTNSSGGYTGTPARCEIFINPSLYSSKDTSWVTDTVVHEVFHCYQGADYSSLAAFNNAPAWLIEGSAEWVGEILAPTSANGWWDEYLLDINKSLLKRSYDAVGFYAHMAETGNDPWHSFDLMFKAPTSMAAYDLATDSSFRTTWASSLLRKTWGDGWTTTGPAIPPGVWYIPKVTVLGVGHSLSGHVAPYTNAVVAVNTTAQVLQVTVSTPYSRVHDTTDHDFDDPLSGPHRFCLSDCTSSPELAELPRLTPGAVFLALTGNTAGATYTISATNLAPCLDGDWVTTSWTLTASAGSVTGGAGVHYMIKGNQATVDFNGMAPLGQLTFHGEGTEALSYTQTSPISAQSPSSSGHISVTELPGGDVTLTVGGGPPISGNSATSPVHGGSGTWTCSATDMTWHLENSTGSTELDFARLPALAAAVTAAQPSRLSRRRAPL
jgi:hypothetical protein